LLGHGFLEEEVVQGVRCGVCWPQGSRHFWPATEHKPFIVGLTLRFAPSFPWQLRRTTPILDLARTLQSLWEAEEGAERFVLHKLSLLLERLDGM